MNPPHVNKMCQNKPWTDLDLNLGRPEHIKRTCDGSIPSNARIRFMLLENSDRKIAVLEKSTSNKMSNKIRGATFCLCEYMSNAIFSLVLPTWGRARTNLWQAALTWATCDGTSAFTTRRPSTAATRRPAHQTQSGMNPNGPRRAGLDRRCFDPTQGQRTRMRAAAPLSVTGRVWPHHSSQLPQT